MSAVQKPPIPFSQAPAIAIVRRGRASAPDAVLPAPGPPPPKDGFGTRLLRCYALAARVSIYR